MIPASGVIRVIIADDHEIFRDGFRLTLSKCSDVELIDEASNGRDLVKLALQHDPDVIITDIKMPVADGIQATKEIIKQKPHIGIIGLSMFDEEDLIMEMLESGARGYLLKNADKNEVVAAIHAVYKGEMYYCRNTSQRLLEALGVSRFSPSLKKQKVEFTDKEIEIIQLICKELTNKEIADQLFLSVRTVEGYRLKIQEKMGVKNSAGMVVYAIQNGLYTPGK